MSGWQALQSRYEALSLRERAMIAGAVLVAIVAIWDLVFMESLRLSKSGLDSEMAALATAGSGAATADDSDPRHLAVVQAGELQTQLQHIDAQLTSTAEGFVSSQRMIEVLQDVLDRQQRLELVSIRNLPVTSLIAPPDGDTAGTAPYVHAIELVIDGRYVDILEYLAALEALPWKFRWKMLDLTTAGYPLNRVHIELSTLSMEATWLGV